jgi:hypothetical protein
MFPVYGGKCLSRKSFHNWVEKFSEGRSKVADDARRGAEVAETSQKTSYAAGFDALVMRWDGRAIAQAVSRRLPTAAARVQTRVWSCGIL